MHGMLPQRYDVGELWSIDLPSFIQKTKVASMKLGLHSVWYNAASSYEMLIKQPDQVVLFQCTTSSIKLPSERNPIMYTYIVS